MIRSVENAINIVAENTWQQKEYVKQSKNQRRHEVTDLFGIEYQRQGDAQTPATFYISVSNDLAYFERFEFKLIIQPFAQPIEGNGATGSTGLTNSNTSLSVSGTTITPNPHTHSITPNPHNHSINPGISLFNGTATDFSVWIEDLDVTAYLRAQHGGAWINGNGIYPGEGFTNYDILGIIGYMDEFDPGVILSPGYKKVEIRANGTFNVTLVNYLKYSTVNR